MTCCQFCGVLLTTQTWPNTMWEQITQVRGYQEVESIGGHLGGYQIIQT